MNSSVQTVRQLDLAAILVSLQGNLLGTEGIKFNEAQWTLLKMELL